ncbi:MAG: RnfABCDGE type electron transport complex subunit D, partial [Phycisphaerae bacterium]
APLAGRIGPLRSAWSPRRGRIPAVEISPVDESAQTSGSRIQEPHGIESLDRAGPLLDDEGVALARVAADDAAVKPHTLLVRCFDAEPGRLLESFAIEEAAASRTAADAWTALVRAAARLGRRVGCERIVLVTDRFGAAHEHDAATAIRRLKNQNTGIDEAPCLESHRLEGTYPQCHPAVLTRCVTGTETPPGLLVRATGHWVVAASTLLALSDYLDAGRPRMHVPLLLGAPHGVRRLRVPLGTRISSLIHAYAGETEIARIVAGGWLTGTTAGRSDAVIDAGVSALWVFDEVPHRRPIPCIRCGSCVDACPSKLMPSELYDRLAASTSGVQAHAADLAACIGCGLCTYVCPSHLPLARVLVEARDRRTESGRDASRGDPAAMPETEIEIETPAEASHAEAAVAARSDRPLLLDPPQIAIGAGYDQILSSWWLAALLPALAGVILFGPAAVKIIVCAIAAAVITETALTRARVSAVPESLSHAGLIGLLLALTLPATAPLSAALTGGVVAIAFGKLAMGGLGRYLWQPALVGRVAVQFLFSAQLGFHAGLATSPVLGRSHLVFGDVSNAARVQSYSEQGWDVTDLPYNVHAMRLERPVQTLREWADGVAPGRGNEQSLAALLRDDLPPWEDTVLGTVPGAIGETSAIAILVAGLYLVYRGALRGSIPLAVLVVAYVAAAICPLRIGLERSYVWFPGWQTTDGVAIGPAYALYHLTSGSLMFAAVFLAGDPTSSPLTARGRVWFGAGVGVLAIFMRLYGLLETEAYWAILIMNALVPWIDRRTRPRVAAARPES